MTLVSLHYHSFSMRYKYIDALSMTTDADQWMAQISVYGRITNPYFCNTYILLDSTITLLDST